MAKKITSDGEVIETVAAREPQLLSPPLFKTNYNHDTRVESLATALTCLDKSKAQQQFARDADINVILAKFQNTGELALTGTPNYMDVPDNGDLQDQIITQYQVDEAWSKLPAAVRNILKNPRTFVEYVDHCVKTGDLDPLRELGLAKAVAPEPPTPPGGSPAPGPAVKAPVEPQKAPEGASKGA